MMNRGWASLTVGTAMAVAACLPLFFAGGESRTADAQPVAPVVAPLARSGFGVTLPDRVDLQPGRLARVAVTADPKAKVIRWINASPEGLDLIESETGRWAIVSAPKAGTYRVFVYSAIDGEPTPASTCLIRVGAGPDPGPDPVPPDPTDPLTKSLQSAYDRDPPDCAGVPKAKCKDKVLRLYQAAEVTDLENYRTAGELFTALEQMATKVGLPEPAIALPNLRKAIAVELRQILPDDADAALTQDHRANAKSLFIRLVKTLGVVK